MTELFGLVRFLSEWWLIILYVIAIFLVYLRYGWKGAVAVATLGGAYLIYQKGATDNDRRWQERTERSRTEALEKRGKVDDEVTNMSADDRRNQLDQWLRDD